MNTAHQVKLFAKREVRAQTENLLYGGASGLCIAKRDTVANSSLCLSVDRSRTSKVVRELADVKVPRRLKNSKS